MTANDLRAIDPAANVVVHAAAGTGKTWLLTGRIVRLLLAGAEPGAILAITFTRKAAQEMTDRVHQRLFNLASGSDAQLEQTLAEIGVTVTAESRSLARTLYERVLTSPHALRTTTFHAFCQELLRRFAFEASVSPGFELIENDAGLRREAWQALTRELTHAPPGPTVDAMDLLLNQLGSLTSVRDALYDFLDHGSDWWAYTEGAEDPVAFAIAQLAQVYGPIDNNAWQTLNARSDFRALCRDFIATVGPAPAKTVAPARHVVEQILAENANDEESFGSLASAFLTQHGQPRQLGKKLAARETADRRTLAEIHAGLCDAIQEVLAARKAAAAFAATSAWYRCGAQFLAHYQRLKQERNQLDFADLEWQTYRLLTSGEHAEWVQYKLDQRIDHLLIDEFQDTNPTQWRLVLPLLHELAAGNPERRRSVFLVGDEKQSIYRFRRAEAQLFRQAHDWLITHAGAMAQTQDASWRSSPAILAFVNLVFRHARGERSGRPTFSLPEFRTHSAHYSSRAGFVELRPLIEHAENNIPPPGAEPALRNSLTTPREGDEDRRHREEAEWIAARIQGMIEDGIGIETNAANDLSVRRIRYGDIFLLLRDRAHAQTYEDALREAGIPFLGASRGQFQDALEIQDLVNLLHVLVSVNDDLALAGVLRSPLFAFADDALMALAAADKDRPWWQRLADQASQPPVAEPLARAWRLLAHWHRLADRVPVHDLLDRIFFEGDVKARYESATPIQLRARVHANLTHFIGLALDFDSGRYPSLSRFLRSFKTDRPAGSEPSPDAALSSPENCVRVLTIHAAKGLEAPVVFLADAARGGTPRARVPWTLIDWPVEAPGPTRMLLGGRRDRLDRTAHAVYEAQLAATRREEANLLYVAITRARQLLFVSGCAPARGVDLGWYGFVQDRLQRAKDSQPENGVQIALRLADAKDKTMASVAGTLRYGVMPQLTAAPSPPPIVTAADERLYQPFETVLHPARRRPSELPDDPPRSQRQGINWRDARTRGIIIHRALALVTTITDREQARQQLLREYAQTLPAHWLVDCWQEALAVIEATTLRDLFDPSCYREARNELPLLYRDGSEEVFGFIDRVVRTDLTTTIVDYKTNRVTSASDLAALTAHYAPQLQLYARGLAKIWPEDRLRALLVFTNLPQAIEAPLTL